MPQTQHPQLSFRSELAAAASSLKKTGNKQRPSVASPNGRASSHSQSSSQPSSQPSTKQSSVSRPFASGNVNIQMTAKTSVGLSTQKVTSSLPRKETKLNRCILIGIVVICIIQYSAVHVMHSKINEMHSESYTKDAPLRSMTSQVVQSNLGEGNLLSLKANDKDLNAAILKTLKEANVNNRKSEAKSKISTEFNPDEIGRDYVKRILEKSGVTVTKEMIPELPTYAEIHSLYYFQNPLTSDTLTPVIIGNETCQAYRDTVPQSQRRIGGAGLFNTGTNLLDRLLSMNCRIPTTSAKTGKGMLWQVPWGKHSPVWYRTRHAAPTGKNVNQTAVLPVVMIKDPLGWMGSMCRHPYAANWPHSASHCPNLIANEHDNRHKNGDPIPVNVHYNTTHITKHAHLAGLWNDWYGAWLHDTNFPRLIIRFEDLMFQPQTVLREVCHCAGGILAPRSAPPNTRTDSNINDFKYTAESAKGSQTAHAGSSGLVGALQKYGSATARIQGFTGMDLEFAVGKGSALDQELLEMFQYQTKNLGKFLS